MDYHAIIAKFYPPGSKAYEVLRRHSEKVTEKALTIAGNLRHRQPNLAFIEEAAMLHDIGIFRTDAKGSFCWGSHPYIVHGILGRQIMDELGYPQHGLVCERHVGVGITIDDIRSYRLPLPLREMVPVSLEEQIICFADKFYSKTPTALAREKTIPEIVTQLGAYHASKAEKFMAWVDQFMP